MKISQTVSLPKFLSSVNLMSLKTILVERLPPQYLLHVNLCLQGDKTHLHREGLKSHMETQMVQIVQLQREMHQVHFLFFEANVIDKL